jgi:hypothetical protein
MNIDMSQKPRKRGIFDTWLAALRANPGLGRLLEQDGTIQGLAEV